MKTQDKLPRLPRRDERPLTLQPARLLSDHARSGQNSLAGIAVSLQASAIGQSTDRRVQPAAEFRTTLLRDHARLVAGGETRIWVSLVAPGFASANRLLKGWTLGSCKGYSLRGCAAGNARKHEPAGEQPCHGWRRDHVEFLPVDAAHFFSSFACTRWSKRATLTTTRRCVPSPTCSLSSNAVTANSISRPSIFVTSAVARNCMPTGVAA